MAMTMYLIDNNALGPLRKMSSSLRHVSLRGLYEGLR